MPTVSIDNREIILLSGFKTVTSEAATKKPFVVILDERSAGTLGEERQYRRCRIRLRGRPLDRRRLSLTHLNRSKGAPVTVAPFSV